MSRRYHCIIDANNCDNSLLNNEYFIELLLRDITKKIRMNILSGPYIVQGLPANPGITGFCIIDFSHISIHTFTKTNEFCLDVFSCKPFNYGKLYEFIKQTFNLSDSDINGGRVNYDRLEKINGKGSRGDSVTS